MKRVVITGMGVVVPGGVGAKAFWELLTSGRTATRGITLFDAAPFRSRIAAETDFDPAEHGLGPEEAERLDRAAQFAVVSTREAMADSGVEEALDPLRTGVSLGSAVGCTTGLDTEYAVVSDHGRDWAVDHTRAVAHLFDYFVPSSLAAEVARAADAQGPVSLVSNGCTSGLDAIGYAAELIREGSADVMFAGATDAPISPITVACFDAIKATSPRNDDPATASRPFDRTRNGFVLGEGSAVLVLEEFERAFAAAQRAQRGAVGEELRLPERPAEGRLVLPVGHVHIAAGLVHLAQQAMADEARLGGEELRGAVEDALELVDGAGDFEPVD